MSEVDDCEKPVETTTTFAGGGAATVVLVAGDVVVEPGVAVVVVTVVVVLVGSGLATVVPCDWVLAVELEATLAGIVQAAALVSRRRRERWPATNRTRRRAFS